MRRALATIVVAMAVVPASAHAQGRLLGRHVYVAAHSSNGVAWLARDAATGALTPAGCLKELPRADRCRGGFGLEGTSGVAVSPDGAQVYVTADKPGSVSV